MAMRVRRTGVRACAMFACRNGYLCPKGATLKGGRDREKWKLHATSITGVRASQLHAKIVPCHRGLIARKEHKRAAQEDWPESRHRGTGRKVNGIGPGPRTKKCSLLSFSYNTGPPGLGWPLGSMAGQQMRRAARSGTTFAPPGRPTAISGGSMAGCSSGWRTGWRSRVCGWSS